MHSGASGIQPSRARVVGARARTRKPPVDHFLMNLYPPHAQHRPCARVAHPTRAYRFALATRSISSFFLIA